MIRRIRRGDQRHLVSVIAVTATPDGISANGTKAASVHVTCYAAVWPVSAKESLSAAGERRVMEVTHRIQMDYYAGVTADMFVLMPEAERIFEIVSIINPEERNVYYDILAKEGAIGNPIAIVDGEIAYVAGDVALAGGF